MNAAAPSLSCPKCGSDDVRSRGRRLPCPLGWLGLLELRSGWLLRRSMPEEFTCEACGARFARRTLGAKVALVVRWVGIGVLAGLVALGVALAVMERRGG